MTDSIKDYYLSNGMPSFLMAEKLKKFDQNKDIAAEFEYWIKNGKYCEDNPVTIEGYTAERLSQLSQYLNGEGAFLLLIDLREKPEDALAMIEKGFKIK